MNFQATKVSASGHELGSNILFSKRIGFSGTPSNLLPKDLGDCEYEPGSDGKIINTLTSPIVTSCSFLDPDWNAKNLLLKIAQEQNPFHALIDTGKFPIPSFETNPSEFPVSSWLSNSP